MVVYTAYTPHLNASFYENLSISSHAT